MHIVRPTVNIFFIKTGKILLGRRTNTGWMDGWLCPFGGHVELGETPTQAALREIREEVGVHLKPAQLEFLCVAARNSLSEYVAYEFTVQADGLSFINNEPQKCSELVWVDATHLPDDVIPDFRDIIQLAIIGGKRYLEIGY